MADNAQVYNISAIRELLLAAFTSDELRRFCQDRPSFGSILDDFSPNAGLRQIADALITWCDKRILFEELLDGVKEVNASQYERFEPELRTPAEASPAPTIPSEPKSKDRNPPTATEPERGQEEPTHPIPRRAWWLLALLFLDLALALLWGWCLVGNQPLLMPHFQTIVVIVAVLLAVLGAILAKAHPVQLEVMVRHLGINSRWRNLVLVLTMLAILFTSMFWPLRWLKCCPIPMVIALRSFHDDRFVTATDAGYKWVLKTEPHLWSERQWFTLECLNGGKISLKAYNGYNRKYTTAMDGNSAPPWVIQADAPEVREWEKFTMVDAETGEELPCSDRLALQLFGEDAVKICLKTAHGRYVTTMNDENGRGWILTAETGQLVGCEAFTVVLRSP